MTTGPDYIRGLRTAAYAAGKCYECCSRPHLPGRRRCQVCRDRNLARRSDVGVGMMCRGLCGKPSAPGRARCEDCLAKHRSYMETRRRESGVQPRAKAQRRRRIMTPRPRKIQTSDGPRMADPAHPAEAPMRSRRRAVAPGVTVVPPPDRLALIRKRHLDAGTAAEQALARAKRGEPW